MMRKTNTGHATTTTRTLSRPAINTSIRYRLMIWFLALSLFPLGIAGYFAYSTASHSLQIDVEEKLARITINVLDKIDRMVFERIRDVQEWSSLELAKMAVQIGSGIGGASDFVNNVVSKHRVYSFIMLLDRDGICVTANTINHEKHTLPSDDLFLGEDFSGKSWFKEAIRPEDEHGEHVVVSDWRRVGVLDALAAATGQPDDAAYSMIFSSAIRDFDGTVLGVWVNFLNWAVVQEMLEQIQTEIPEVRSSVMSFLLLADNETIIAYSGIASHAEETLYQKSLAYDLQQPQLVDRLGSAPYMFTYLWENKSKTVVLSREQGFEHYRGKDWGLLLISDNAATFAQILALRSKILFIGLLTTLCIVVLSYFIGHRVATPLIMLSGTAASIASGDLSQYMPMRFSQHVPVDTRDEIEILFKSFTQMRGNLQQLIRQIKAAGSKVSHSSENILTAFQRLSDVSAQHASAIVQTTATVEEFAATSREIAANTQIASDLAETTQHEGHRGVKAANNTLTQIHEIKQANDANREHVAALHTHSQEINKIVETITNIADNTELIAFNAALEAASAGEKGRRFSVVASEIRHLANTVASSVKNIEQQTSKIQRRIQDLVDAFDAETERVEQGVLDMNVTAASFDRILEKIQKTATSLLQISAATRQQQHSNELIVTTLQEMSQETLQFKDIARQTHVVTQELTYLAEQLQGTINVFQIDDHIQ